MTNVVGNSTSLRSLEMKSHLLNPVQCPIKSGLLRSFCAPSSLLIFMSLLDFVTVLESESEGIGVHRSRVFSGEFPVGPASQHHSTHSRLSCLGMGNTLLLETKEKVVLSCWRECSSIPDLPASSVVQEFIITLLSVILSPTCSRANMQHNMYKYLLTKGSATALTK